ncbi:TIGR02678 family protein [Paenibacillus sp. JNUCC32]|uniref:TIGR02678 family protein n=1 Tax=Paenibacillus sp. JNUCC32 TaxID=2777984 RepID=UPI001787C5A9|nr:TIGR02678 family protein [Paenibacillus sp. JNUCC-32]QOT11186.1 TIGR02678 family protein [Paenibacillus sp. JNUCC-32]
MNEIIPFQDCVRALFDRYWIRQADDPEMFYAIKKQEGDLEAYFRTQFRYHLIVDGTFAKLEKIPFIARPSMGILEFEREQSYVFFACLLAYFEDKGEDQQFLLQDACEAILNYAPKEAGAIKWEDKSTRKAFVEALRFCRDQHIIEEIDQQIEGFRDQADHEVLLQTTSMFRRVLTLYFSDLSKLQTIEEFECAVQKEIEEATTPKQRIMRTWFLESALRHEELTPQEREALDCEIESWQAEIESQFDFMHVERYKSMSMIVHSEYHYGHYYPYVRYNQTMNASIQWATEVFDKVRSGEIIPDLYGRIRMHEREAFQIFLTVKEKFHYGWNKDFTLIKSSEAAWKMVFEVLEQFSIVRSIGDKQIYCYDLAGRITGEYLEEEN